MPTNRLPLRCLAVVMLAALGIVAALPNPATSASAASGACVARLINTKHHKSGICVRYVHTILIGDGISLEKASTSTHFTGTSKNAVKRFQAEQRDTVKKVSGSVDRPTWIALCTVAAQRRLEQYALAGCSQLVAAPANLAAPDYRAAELTVASWNVLQVNKPARVAAGAKAISQHADLLGFQELNFKDTRTRARRTLVDCVGCNHSGYFPDPPGNGWATRATVSLIWNKQRFTALTTGTYAVLGKNTYGANTSRKWINWVLLRDDATGRKFYFLNTHFVAGVDAGGLPTTKAPEQKNYQHHMTDLLTLIRKFTVPGADVILAGDFNVDYRLDQTVGYFPRLALNGLNLRSGWERLALAGIDPSSGSVVGSSRIVDGVWTPDDPTLEPVSATIGADAYSSDHYPVMYTTRVQPAATAN
jgi:exonuclease III